MNVIFRAAEVSVQPMRPKRQLWDWQHGDAHNICAFMCLYNTALHWAWIKTPHVNEPTDKKATTSQALVATVQPFSFKITLVVFRKFLDGGISGACVSRALDMCPRLYPLRESLPRPNVAPGST